MTEKAGNWLRVSEAVQDEASQIPDLTRWNESHQYEVARTYTIHGKSAFKGNRKFIRDDQAQKAFSKLRSSIAGMYNWRLGRDCPPEYAPKNSADLQALVREADFASLFAKASSIHSTSQ